MFQLQWILIVFILDELVKTIRLDIEYAEQKLDKHSQMDKYFNS